MIELILLLIGICIGIIVNGIYTSLTCKVAGALNIDTSDDKKDLYTFEVKVPLVNLKNYKMIRVQISHNIFD